MLAITLTILIGYSRIYLIVHTFNQILFGWSLGLWMAFYFHFCIRNDLIEHVRFITEMSDALIPYLRYSLWVTLAYLVVLFT